VKVKRLCRPCFPTFSVTAGVQILPLLDTLCRSGCLRSELYEALVAHVFLKEQCLDELGTESGLSRIGQCCFLEFGRTFKQTWKHFSPICYELLAV
jgi:hypothetical protein